MRTIEICIGTVLYLLTAYDGVEFEYDGAGNPLTYYNGTNWTFTWGKQKRLETATSGGNTINFYYTEDGMRNLKYANGVNYHYIYNGGKLMRMYTDDVTMDFIYDAQGQPFAMIHNGRILYYVLNLQGDVVRLVDSDGESFGVYRYDAWGNIIYASDNQWINDNPLRYRGYVYDTETNLYYCQSRYYDPAIGRFLNADGYASTGQGFIGYNMFAYCNNNPIAFADHEGMIPVRELSCASVLQEPRNKGYLIKKKLDTGIPSEFAKEMDALCWDIIGANSVDDWKRIYNTITGYQTMDNLLELNKIRAGVSKMKLGIATLVLFPDPTILNEAYGAYNMALGFGYLVIGVGEVLNWTEED